MRVCVYVVPRPVRFSRKSYAHELKRARRTHTNTLALTHTHVMYESAGRREVNELRVLDASSLN